MKHTACLLVALLALLAGFAAPDLPKDDPTPEEVEQALQTATRFFRSIATGGGYAGILSLDGKERYGEAFYEEAAPTEIWIQPPGTPSVGGTFLRAYRQTGDTLYLAAARDAAQALAWGQLRSGGWDHRADVAGLQPGRDRPDRPDGSGTFDDDITQGALSFLMEMDEVVEAPWLTAAVERGLGYLLESQFENGGWPQWYPLRGGYHDYLTFNDNAINDVIRVLVEAHRRYGADAYLEAARRGGDFILRSQGAPPQAGWAQQYTHDLRPAPARSFEPAGLSSAETARNIHTLIDLYLYTREERYLAPVPAALAWLERSRIDAGRWARLYELETNRPIYGDRDGEVYYRLQDISEERQRGYSWEGAFGVEGAAARYDSVRTLGAARYLALQDEPPTTQDREQALAELRPRVRQVLTSLDEQGRWTRGGMIYSADFVENANLLLDYLVLAE